MARVKLYIGIKVSEDLTASSFSYACSNVSDTFAASVLVGVKKKLFLLLE